jgi:uncharacterized protein (DUF1778 family)
MIMDQDNERAVFEYGGCQVTRLEIPADQWDYFLHWLLRPARTIPVLQRLAQRKPAWQEG